jgi:hypothetical protein
MRETENEINLLVPGGEELYAPTYGAPEWTFAPPNDGDDDTDSMSGDELGDAAWSESASPRDDR